MNVRIKTTTSKGTVMTYWSDDEWNVSGWETIWTEPHPLLPISEIKGLEKGGKTWEEAGRNHLAMCQNIKVDR